MTDERDQERINLTDEWITSIMGESGGVLGHYVLVAEVVYPHKVELQVITSSGIAPWTAQGMLEAAQEVISIDQSEFIFEPEEIDEEEDGGEL